MHLLRSRLGILTLLALVWAAPVAAPAAEPIVTHALTELGTPKYGPEVGSFAYANPDAPKGGAVTLGVFPEFDSLNFIPRQGVFATPVALIHAPLMAASQDELGVYYGAIASHVTHAADASWITFHLRPEARFSDGVPVTADDVVWTFEQIMAVGSPILRAQYAEVAGVEADGPHAVTFRLTTTGQMKPLTRLATLTVQPKHYWTAEGRDIGQTTLEPPIGAGPYRLTAVTPGSDLRFERIEDFWGQDLPVYRGQYNFDRIDYDYYRDRTVLFQAFIAGEYDLRREFSSKNWAQNYAVDAIRDGRMRRAEIDGFSFRGMQGYGYNTRLAKFQDSRVREALGLIYPFEWVNETIMFSSYDRLDSYFPNSGFGMAGPPAPAEAALLEPYRDQLDPRVFTEPFQLPRNPQNRASRENIRAALGLLSQAGWTVQDGVLSNAEGTAFRFEILVNTPLLNPHTQAWLRNLERIGVTAEIRVVDSAQYQARFQERDFDVIIFVPSIQLPPGPELRGFFGSGWADVPGSFNHLGIQDPVVDGLIEAVLAAGTEADLRAATAALDRVLMWSHYVVPHWFSREVWLAWWDRFGFPEPHPRYNLGFPASIGFQPTWWIDPDRDAQLTELR